jgi:hypothetical protein
MSICLLPLTRAERPPFRGGPPISTTFDGGFSDDYDPRFEVTLESAAKLLATIGDVADDQLEVTLRLLKQRRIWIELELAALRVLNGATLPPIGGFELDAVFDASDELEQRFLRMLDRLSSAVQRVQEKIDMQQCPFPLSDS